MTTKASDHQVGGDHYKSMGDYQPWDVLKHWLTPEEYRGYQKGVAIAYLARERQKGGDQDISKAAHHLQKLVEVLGEKPADTDPMVTPCCGDFETCTKPCVPRAESEADPDGWIEWHGGSCPVPAMVNVGWRLRDGREYGCEPGEKTKAGELVWGHTGRYSAADIVAYRLIKKPE